MNIWNFLKKDWAIFFKDRGAMIALFILPLLFIVIFSGLAMLSMGGSVGGAEKEGEEQDTRSPIAVVNLDKDGEIARQFLASMDRVEGFKTVLYEQADAEALIQKLKISRYLLIPADFTSRLSQGQRVTITLVVHPNANLDSTRNLLDIISGVGDDTSLELQILDGIRMMGEMQASNPSIQTGFNAERVMQQAKKQFEDSRQTPLLDIVEREPVVPEKDKTPILDLSQSFVPGFCVLFVFLAASTVARSLFEEKKTGTLRRLVASPLSRSTLLAGKMVPIFLLTLIQIGIMFLVGVTILPALGFGTLNIGNSPFAWALTSILLALCSTCLGVLIAGIVRSESQVSGISNVLLWVAGFLGGAIFPPFIIQKMPVLNVLSRMVPQSYATTAYYDILTRGKGLADIWLDLVVLLAFSALFFIIGVNRFKFE